MFVGPSHEVVVDEFAAVIAVDAGDIEGHGGGEEVECCEDVLVGVIADGVGKDPSGVDVGEVHGAAELAFECWSAVGDGIDFEESWFGFDFVTGFADGDRVTQQCSWFSGCFAPDGVFGPGWGEVAVNRGSGHC